MSLPSLDRNWKNSEYIKPKIYVLEIKDRKTPEGEPIAWLLVEREESHKIDSRDGSTYEASMCLHYERIGPNLSFPNKGEFRASYHRGFGDGEIVSLTSSSLSRGAVFLDLSGLKGQLIGTYLMNEIVLWVQQWPEAIVNSVELLQAQADEANKERRNRFYEQFGLEFEYSDPEKREQGKSKPIPASTLTPVNTWKMNICERDVREYMNKLIAKHDQLRFDLSCRERAVKKLSAEITDAEKHPIRWALRQIWWRLAPTLGLVVMLATVVAAIWVNLKTNLA